MGLYPKHLNSVAQLKSEKQALKKAIEETSLEKIFSSEVSDVKESISGNKFSNVVNIILSLLGTESVFDAILTFVPSISKNAFTNRLKKILFSAGKEIISGYAKWEAAELALRGIQLFIRSRKRRKKQEDEKKDIS